MIEKRGVFFVSVILLFSGVCYCLEVDDLKSDWNDFLHYTAIGRIDLVKHYYRVEFESQGLDLAKLLNHESNQWQPVPTDCSLKINLEGLGANNFKITVHGPQSPFELKLAGQIFHFNQLGHKINTL